MVSTSKMRHLRKKYGDGIQVRLIDDRENIYEVSKGGKKIAVVDYVGKRRGYFSELARGENVANWRTEFDKRKRRARQKRLRARDNVTRALPSDPAGTVRDIDNTMMPVRRESGGDKEANRAADQRRSAEKLRQLEAQGPPRNENERILREVLRQEAAGNIDYATTAGGQIEPAPGSPADVGRPKFSLDFEGAGANIDPTDDRTASGGVSTDVAVSPKGSPRNRGEFMFANPGTQRPNENRAADQRRSAEKLRQLEAQGPPRNARERALRDILRQEASGNIQYATTTGGGASGGQTVGARHRVRRGDTLSALARQYGMSVQQLAAANPDITDINRINVGQMINIPGETVTGGRGRNAPMPSRGGGDRFVLDIPPYRGEPTPRDRGEFMFANPGTQRPNGRPEPAPGSPSDRGASATVPPQYTVRRGDNLTRIARQYGIGLQDLLALNPGITNPNLIREGQNIIVGRGNAADQGDGTDWYRGGEFRGAGPPIDTSGLGDRDEYMQNLRQTQGRRAAAVRDQGYTDRFMVEDPVNQQRMAADRGWTPDGRRYDDLADRNRDYQDSFRRVRPTAPTHPNTHGSYDSEFHGRYTPSTGRTNYTERRLPTLDPNAYQDDQGGAVGQPGPTQPTAVQPVPGGGGGATDVATTAPVWDPNAGNVGDVGGIPTVVSPVASQQTAIDAYLQNAMEALRDSRRGVDEVYSRRDIEASDLFRLIGPRPDLSRVIRDLQQLNPSVPVAVGSRDVVKQQSALDGADRTVDSVVKPNDGVSFSNAVQRQKNEDLSMVRDMPVSMFGNKHIAQSYARVLDLYDEMDALKDAGQDVRRWVKETGRGDISLGLLNAFSLNKSREVNDRISQLQRQIDSATRVLTIQRDLQDRQDTLRKEEREWQYRMSRDSRRDWEADRAFHYGMGRDARSDYESDRAFQYGMGRDARRDYEADRGFALGVYDRDTRAYESDRAFAMGLDRENARRFESDRAFQEGRLGRAEDNLYRALGLNVQQGRYARQDMERDRSFLAGRQDEVYRRQFDLYRQQRGEYEYGEDLKRRDRALEIDAHRAESSRISSLKNTARTADGEILTTGAKTAAQKRSADYDAYRQVAKSYGPQGLGQQYVGTFERAIQAGDLDWTDLERFAGDLGVDLNVDTGWLDFRGNNPGSEAYNAKVQAIGQAMYKLATGSEGDIGRLSKLISSYGL